jgi:hypothetical protein
MGSCRGSYSECRVCSYLPSGDQGILITGYIIPPLYKGSDEWALALQGLWKRVPTE